VKYDNSLVVTITVTCYSWASSSGDQLFTCGAIYLPPHGQQVDRINQLIAECRLVDHP